MADRRGVEMSLNMVSEQSDPYGTLYLGAKGVLGNLRKYCFKLEDFGGSGG